MTGTTPQVRVGDRERRAVDEQLRAAVGEGVLTLAEYEERCGAVWGARTRADLDGVLADLPPADLPPADRPRPAPPLRPRGLRPRGLRRRLPRLGVPGFALLLAAGVLASGTDGRALFGSDELAVTGADPEVAVSVLFGSVRVVVPDGVRANTSGLVAFGSLSCADACAPRAGAREVAVRGLGGFGSVEVLTAAEAAAQDEAERAEDLLDDLDDERDD